mgnify:CR=1 FL=1|jgi:hypothetical protein
MSISGAIAKAQSGSDSSSKQVDNLERGLDVLESYGCIKPDNPQSGPAKRGRPPKSKSKSPGRAEAGLEPPSEFPRATPSKVDAIIDKMNRTRLLTKLQAYNAYWPQICPLQPGELASLSAEDLQRLVDMFELSVNSFSEIIDIPQSIKTTIAQLEPFAINVAAKNPNSYWLSKGKYMTGFTDVMNSNPNVDRNVKLIAIRLLGKFPRNPILSLVYQIASVAFTVIQYNQAREANIQVSEEYANL